MKACDSIIFEIPSLTVTNLFYYIKLKSHLSVCIFLGHVNNSVIPAWIDSGLGLWLVLVLSFMEFVFINF